MDVDHLKEADTTTVMMTAAVEAMAEAVMIIVEAIAEMIVIVDMAAETVMMDILHESTDINAMTGTVVEVVMTDVEEVEEDILIVMNEQIVANVAQPVMLHQQLATATLLLEKLGNHTEVEATMMRKSPVVIIDC